MVVLEMMRWRSPAVLMLLVVLLANTSPVAPPQSASPNNFVEIFSGDAAVSFACWNHGMVGSCHDIRYTSLMDMMSRHGFAFLACRNCDCMQYCGSIDAYIYIYSIFHTCIAQLRLVCREVWDIAPGGICLIGLCCNSFTKMLLGMLGISECFSVSLICARCCARI